MSCRGPTNIYAGMTTKFIKLGDLHAQHAQRAARPVESHNVLKTERHLNQVNDRLYAPKCTERQY